MIGLLSLVEIVDQQVKEFSYETPLQSYEDIYSFLLVTPEFEIDLNKPTAVNQSLFSELGPTNLPPQEFRILPEKAPADDAELRELIFDQFNRAYLEEIFRLEFTAYGERNFSEFRVARNKPLPGRHEVEAFYKERTDGRSPDQRYQSQFEFEIARVEFRLPKEFEHEKASSYYKDAYQRVFGKMGERLAQAYEAEAAAAGYKDLEEASSRGFLFTNSLSKLPKWREESLRDLVNQLQGQIDAADLKENRFVFSGEWEKLQEQVNLVFGDGSPRAKESIISFHRHELSGNQNRKLLYIENELYEDNEGPVLVVWSIISAKVLEHTPLFKQEEYLYGEIERELQSRLMDSAFLELFKRMIRSSTQYVPQADGSLAKYSKLDDLLDSLSASDLSQIIQNASAIEHERLLRTGEWKFQRHFRRTVR